MCSPCLFMAWASSSSGEHMKVDVPIGDRCHMSGGAAPPECQTAVPGVSVYETPPATPVKGTVLHFITAMSCYRH